MAICKKIKYHCLNGKIVTESNTLVSVNDIGFLRGYGVFDFLETYNGNPFLLKEHYNRLKKSAKMLNLNVPISQKDLDRVIKQLLAKNKIKDANIRIIITGGKTENGMNSTSPSLFILTENKHKLPENVYSQGAKLITYEYMRDLPEAKTLDYKIAISLQKLREKKNAIEILYKYDGLVLEATTSNFFIFKGDALITPKNNVLMGITRNFVIKLAGKAKFPVKERNLPLKELGLASEAFITSTTKKIAPIVKIDNLRIGDGKVGKNTKRLMNLFQEHIKNY